MKETLGECQRAITEGMEDGSALLNDAMHIYKCAMRFAKVGLANGEMVTSIAKDLPKGYFPSIYAFLKNEHNLIKKTISEVKQMDKNINECVEKYR